METSSTDVKCWLLNELAGKADWCCYVATLFPDDRRSLNCSKTLQDLADVVETLPDTHPLFSRLRQITRVDDHTHERWLDEIHLEFSYIGFLSAESVQQAIQRLIEITDSSLNEWRRSRKLH